MKPLTDFLQGLRKSALVKTSLVYTLINFLNKAFPFFLLPLFTRALSLDEYGSFAIYRSTMNICIPIVGLSLSEAVIRKYYEKEKIDFGTYLFSVLFMNVITLACCLLLALACGKGLYNVTRLPVGLICMALLISFFTSVNNIERGLYRCEKRNRIFGIIVVGQSFCYFIAISTLYIVHKLHLMPAVYVEVAVYFIFSIYGVWHIINKYNVRAHFKKEYVKSALRFSFPLILNSIMAYIFALSDRYLINYELGAKEVAIYSATFQLVSILQIFAASFNTAWVHWIYESLTKHIAIQKLVRIQMLLIAGFFVAGLVFGIAVYKLLPLIAGEKYKNGLVLIGWFVGSNVLQAFYWIYSPILQFYNKNWFLLGASVPAVIFSIALNVNFLKTHGIIFAAIINCVSWFIIFIVTVFSCLYILRNAYKQIATQNL